MSRAHRVVHPALWLLVAGGCNAIFGVEDPVLVDSNAGAGGDVPSSHGGSVNHGGESGRDGSGDGGDGMAGAGGAENGGTAGSGLDEPLAGSPSTGGSGVAGAGPGDGGNPTTNGGSTGSGGATPSGGTSATGGAPAPAGGSGGAAECSSGARECEDAEVEKVCTDGSWTTNGCPQFGCLGDRCAVCEPATYRCSTNAKSVQVCTEEGVWGSPTACTNSTCLPDEGCAGDCAPGQVRCNPDHDDAESCDDGAWRRDLICSAPSEICVIESGEAGCVDNNPKALGPDQPFAGGALESVAPNVLRVYPLPLLASKSEVVTFGVIGAGTPSSFARLALYADDGERPGALIESTGSLRLDGSETATELSAITILLAPNTQYWLGVLFSTQGNPQIWARTTTGVSAFQTPHTFGSFPDPFPADGAEVFNTEWNLFLTVRTWTPD